MIFLKWYIIIISILCILIEFKAVRNKEIAIGGFILALFIFLPILIYASAN